MTDLENLARAFHEAYETLAPSFGYTTRPETREFDPNSANGRLMIAVCEVVLGEEGRRIRAASRIEGLEEAMQFVCVICANGEQHAQHPKKPSAGGSSECGKLRARIQELKNQPNNPTQQPNQATKKR